MNLKNILIITAIATIATRAAKKIFNAAGRQPQRRQWAVAPVSERGPMRVCASCMFWMGMRQPRGGTVNYITNMPQICNGGGCNGEYKHGGQACNYWREWPLLQTNRYCSQ